jgi:hypothetical protein
LHGFLDFTLRNRLDLEPSFNSESTHLRHIIPNIYKMAFTKIRQFHINNVKTFRGSPLAEISGSLGDLGTLVRIAGRSLNPILKEFREVLQVESVQQLLDHPYAPLKTVPTKQMLTHHSSDSSLS